MADLGVIGRIASDMRTFPAKGVRGTVTSEATPFRYKVNLYRRDTGELVNFSYTNVNGQFTIASTRSIETEAHFVVALDKYSAGAMNAVVRDLLIPVTIS